MGLGQRTEQRIARTALLGVLVLLIGVGCNRNPYAANGYMGAPYASQYPGGAPMAGGMPGAMGGYPANAQVAELERRIQQLDLDNRQLTTQLAQSQQKWQVADQRAMLFQQQLQDTNSQLQQARLAQQDLQGQTRGLQASINSRGGATIRPNTSGPTNALPGLIGGPANGPGYNNYPPAGQGVNPGVNPSPGINPSLNPYGQPSPNLGASNYTGPGLGSLASGAASLPSLSNIQVPGATVQAEGQAVRVRVPADQLFAPGSPQLNPNSYQVLDRVADAIFRNYPRQRVAVEAHTDTGSLSVSGQPNQFQLATSQSQAVINQLVRRNSIPQQQLTVVAHGPNFPRGDNQSAAGRAANRRIEFVVYPDQF